MKVRSASSRWWWLMAFAAVVGAGWSVPPPVPGYPVGWCIRARPEACADARAAGFEYVELALQDLLGLSPTEFAQRADELAAAGPPAYAGYNPFPRELPLVGPQRDDAALDRHLDLLLERASALKLTYVIFNSGACWRVPDGYAVDRAFAELVDFSRRFADRAAAHGLGVLVAPLRPTDSNQVVTIAQAVQLVHAVDRPNFGLMVDYSFVVIGQDRFESLRAAGPKLRHVHLANPASNRGYPMDAAESDYAALFRVLREMNYRGGLSVHAGTRDFNADAPRAITFLRGQAALLAAPRPGAASAP